MSLSSSLTDWYQKWFYVHQQPGCEVACDILRVLEAQDSWSVRPSDGEMEEVRELLALIDWRCLDGPMVATNFI